MCNDDRLVAELCRDNVDEEGHIADPGNDGLHKPQRQN